MQRANLILALIGMIVISRVDWQHNMAIAEVTDRSFAATCTASPVVGYSADLSITLVANAPLRNAAPTFATAALSLINGINGDADPPVGGQTIISSGSESGSVLVTFQGPKAKISGLGCQPLMNSSLLFRAKINDNSSKVKVSVQAPTESNTVWNNARRIDNSTTGFTTHGTSGTIHSSPINDTTDAEGATNGEIVFGSADPSKGGYEVQTLLKVSGSALNNESEEISLIFTPS